MRASTSPFLTSQVSHLLTLSALLLAVAGHAGAATAQATAQATTPADKPAQAETPAPASAAPQTPAQPAAAPAPAPAPTVDLTRMRHAPAILKDDDVHQAIAAALAADKASPTVRWHAVDTIRANQYEVFADAMAEARVPDCLHGDALKRAPAAIGPIAFVGLYAIPFVILAKLRGKCN